MVRPRWPGWGHIPRVVLTFDYFKPEELLLVAATVALGVLLARTYMRSSEPVPIRVLRSIHSGSVNDYAAFAVAGLVLVIAVLLG